MQVYAAFAHSETFTHLQSVSRTDELQLAVWADDGGRVLDDDQSPRELILTLEMPEQESNYQDLGEKISLLFPLTPCDLIPEFAGTAGGNFNLEAANWGW